MRSALRATAAAACFVGLAACSSNSAPQPPSHVTTTPEVVDSPTIGFRVGAATDMRTSSGATVKVRLDRARSVVGSDRPTPAGKRLFAVRFELTDPGRAPVVVAWASDALDDTHPHGGKTRPVASVSRIDVGPLLATPLKLAPGQTASGWVSYYISTKRKVVAVDFLTSDDTPGIAGWAMTSQR